jgi:hypothetical protein
LWWYNKFDILLSESPDKSETQAVPATSIPSEKICSSAGLIVTKLRNILSSEVVDQIIFLNKNKIKVPRNEPYVTD